ncbi:ubiquinol cytochrome-c reductase assembly protein Cbp3 [Schizosaccharomyces cryophilus OY26]|uniref:Ubiquinol cytochrome-c reductase assembly protein Cbp3 n=1 Tax=Schizosaccharomyces cryophilus (strain OY26 / ATCC MYA-4695 / CBS 11777 / NBRC 106824 / NRRL Y48691) TaxID=653667 RepID=S9VRL0_SCHCR|nr:ubiquinol cytochrome-c reductase assembly protein Cbp3 [Schizosaccharomyces cryophilus OY26]EPY50573.1 ubiquinol cytochrome-c reductase assembly protein Cbp3 [Schizosaccharomyces cryophilus OY26]
MLKSCTQLRLGSEARLKFYKFQSNRITPIRGLHNASVLSKETAGKAKVNSLNDSKYKPLTPPKDPRNISPPNSFLAKASLLFQKIISPKQNMFFEATSTARYFYYEASRQATPERDSQDAFQFWFRRCEIPMTFQSWFQITQLHLWILQTRIRALQPQEKQALSQALVTRFFEDMEFRIHKDYRINSDRITGMYLKDLFQQQTGAIFGYDQSMLGNDAVLATAIWRNLFAGSHNLDLTILAEIVAFVRLNVFELSKISNDEFMSSRDALFIPPGQQIEKVY